MGLLDFFKKGRPAPAKTPTGAFPPTSASAPQPTQVNQPANDSYTVKTGDSLSKIAQRYYGDAKQWRKIYEANKDQISNPDLIHPGQTFRIPKV